MVARTVSLPLALCGVIACGGGSPASPPGPLADARARFVDGGEEDLDGGSPDAGLDGGLASDAGFAPFDAGPELDATPPPFEPGGGFTDVTALSGLDFVHHASADFLPCTLPESGCAEGHQTGGLAVGDPDDDGDPDVFLTSLSGPDRLFRNRGDGTFEDATAELGLDAEHATNGAAFGDVNGDGRLDLVVLGYGAPRHFLWIQQADGTFREEALARGLDVDRGRLLQGISATLGDYDADGWLDLHVTEWVQGEALRAGEGGASATRLFRNRGAEAPGHFEDVTDAAGVNVDAVDPDGSHAFTSTFTDLDGDGRPDLAIASDFGGSRLFWNRGDGTFEDATRAAGVGTDGFGMGSAIADYDGDGDLDWFVSSIGEDVIAPGQNVGNRLYVNQGERRFAEVARLSGVFDADWAWGTVFADLDADADLDLVVVNGYRSDYPSRFFFQEPGGVFFDRSEALGAFDYGQGRALARLDLEGDGDVDLVSARNVDAPILLRNDLPGGAWLQIDLRQPGRPNAFAIGARVRVVDATGRSQLRERRAGGAFEGSHEGILHVGLGDVSACPVDVHVRWPDGAETTRSHVACDQRLRVTR